MKKQIATLLALIMMASFTIELERIRCTVYTAQEGSVTASGKEVREGIIAGKPEWMGQTAKLFSENGEFIGEYQILDTGKTEGIKNGTVIDVFCSSQEKCDEWVEKYGDYVLLRRNDESIKSGNNN